MNLLLIDHEDSFTYNLAHLLSGFGNLEVKNFYDIKEKSIKKSDIIIFSPGPGKLAWSWRKNNDVRFFYGFFFNVIKIFYF